MLRSGLRSVTRSLGTSKQIWSGAGAPVRRPAPVRMQLELGSGGGSPGSGGRGGGGGRLCATGGSGDAGNSGKRSSVWDKYSELLETSPFITRTVTCGVLNAVGDIFCQLFVEANSDYNAKRTLLFFAIGTAYVGPLLYYWYGFLTKLIPGSSFGSVFASLAMDQLVFAPAFVGSFMSLMTLIEGKGMDGVKSKLQADWVDAVKVNWGIWVPAQFINFRFVPPQFRVLATNITALVWNTYISWATYKDT